MEVICFQGHAEHVLAMDNLLLGHLPMEMIVTVILLAARIPVAFLNKLINVCAGRQLVGRKEEGEMMVQGWAPALAVNLCPKTSRTAKPMNLFAVLSLTCRIQHSLPATDTVVVNSLVTACHRQIFTVKGSNGSI